VQFVDEPRLQVLAYRGRAAPMRTSLPGAEALARSSASWMPPVTKWKVVPPIFNVGRAWCVSTNTWQ
jgi:hypothetical protein